MLERSEWYDIARDTNWTPSYVSREALFPPEMGDPYGIPIEEWETFDEPYKVSYREYVTIQREKDSAAYSVKAALARSKFYEQADEGWACVLKLHYGAVALTEYQACQFQARMSRFGPSPAMRNMSVYGMLDELRHTQLQLFFPHELVHLDRQYDWAHEAQHSKNWAVLGGRHAFDDIMMTRDAVTSSIMVSFAFETALTNLQMIGLSTDAANMGDHTFSNLITSIQSDEARHAQLGTPTIEIMIRNGRKKEAQLAMDIALWRVWRLFSITVGIPMDYYIPLEQRHMSFKEFMHEWVINQWERQVQDLGLERPWYWDIFLTDIDNHHHCQQGGIWSWRPTVWWNPPGAVGPKERAWLEEKYPGWNESYGSYWDVITNNLLQGHEEKTHPQCIPIICNMCQIRSRTGRVPNGARAPISASTASGATTSAPRSAAGSSIPTRSATRTTSPSWTACIRARSTRRPWTTCSSTWASASSARAAATATTTAGSRAFGPRRRNSQAASIALLRAA